MIHLERKHLVLLLEVGYVFVGMRRFKQAKQVFESVHLLAPQSDVPVIALGGVAFCEGDFKKAIHFYQKALKLDPESIFAKAYLGEVLIFSGKNETGEKLLSEVKKTDPDGAAGRFAEALLLALKKGFEPQKTPEGKKRHARKNH